MNYYKMAFQRFSDFSGRSRRSEFWYFVLFNMLASGVAFALDMILGVPILYSLYMLIALVPGLAVSVRRLHDIGKSGWWILIGLVPVAGVIILIIFYATDSQPGTNQWGNNPKELDYQDMSDHLVE